MSAKIQEISLTTVTEHTGFRGRKQTTEENRLSENRRWQFFSVKKSAVEGAGNSWQLLVRRLKNLSTEKNIPFSDSL